MAQALEAAGGQVADDLDQVFLLQPCTVVHQLAQYAVLASVMALMNVAVMLAYATLGAQMVRAFQGAGLRWLNRVCGGLLIGLAGTLALYRRSTPLS